MTGENKPKQNPIYRHLMNGVSYMVPFIVIGGLLIAIALTMGGVKTPGGLVIPEGSIWKTIESIGAGVYLHGSDPAGFIAMSIADRPGLAPGMVGFIRQRRFMEVKRELDLSGIIAGFLAGYVALAIKRIKVPRSRTDYAHYRYPCTGFTSCRVNLRLCDWCSGCGSV